MHYLEFGTYPQTYVGNTMNATLESWYQASSPTIREEYVTSASASYGQFKGYLYTDGNMYARGISRIYSAEEYEAKDCPSDMKYMSGETITLEGGMGLRP